MGIDHAQPRIQVGHINQFIDKNYIYFWYISMYGMWPPATAQFQRLERSA